MPNKRWIQFIFTVAFIGIVAIILFNYLMNPYHVFSHNYLKEYNHVKDNLVDDEMSKFYAAKDANPDVILVGSSRVEHINPKYLEAYTQGKVYNLGVKGSGLSTQYKLIKYFITKQKVKTVILGLDFYAFSPANIGSYKDTGNTRYDNYFLDDYFKSVLSFRTFRKSLLTLKDNLKHKEGRIVWENGWDTYSHEYPMIQTQSDEWHLNKIDSTFPNFGINQKFFGNESFKNPHSIDKGLEILSEIVALCQQNNVELKLFTTPLYYKVYDVITGNGYANTYNYWKQSLSKYNMIYDFNYKNSVTQNYKNYVDSSHFKANLGEYIFAKMYGNTDKTIEDFGKLLQENLQ